MVARIGAAKVAERFGVVLKTVGDWMKRGVPIGKRIREVDAAYRRHTSAVHASKYAQAYKKQGWRRLKTFKDVDEIVGMDPGHTKERWKERKDWWEEHRPTEDLPQRVAFVVDHDGRLLYVNGDQVLWRGYLVTGKDGTSKLFWTMATYLDGYDTAEEFAVAYESLSGVQVRIHF